MIVMVAICRGTRLPVAFHRGRSVHGVALWFWPAGIKPRRTWWAAVSPAVS